MQPLSYICWQSDDVIHVVTGSRYCCFAPMLHWFCVVISLIVFQDRQGAKVWTRRPGNGGLWRVTLSTNCWVLLGVVESYHMYGSMWGTIIRLPSKRDKLFCFNAFIHWIVCMCILHYLGMRFAYNHYAIAQVYNAANTHRHRAVLGRFEAKELKAIVL